jgi:hypothetical protein
MGLLTSRAPTAFGPAIKMMPLAAVHRRVFFVPSSVDGIRPVNSPPVRWIIPAYCFRFLLLYHPRPKEGCHRHSRLPTKRPLDEASGGSFCELQRALTNSPMPCRERPHPFSSVAVEEADKQSVGLRQVGINESIGESASH